MITVLSATFCLLCMGHELARGRDRASSGSLLRFEDRQDSGIRSDGSKAGKLTATPPTEPKGTWKTIHQHASCEEYWYTQSYLLDKEYHYANPSGDEFCGRSVIKSLDQCKVCCEESSVCTAIDFYEESGCCNLHQAICSPRLATNDHDKPSSFRLDTNEKYFSKYLQIEKGDYGGNEVKAVHTSFQSVPNSDGIVKNLTYAVPDIDQIEFGICRGLTDAGLLHIAETCGNLSRFEVAESNVTDVGLEYLGKGCPNLTMVRMRNSSFLHNPLQIVGEKLPRLQRLYLPYSAFIGEGPFHTTQPHWRLTNLHLAHTGVADVAVEYIVKTFPNLHALDLMASKISNKAVLIIAEGLRRLKYLVLSKNAALTGESLLHSTNTLESLRSLALWSCNLTDVGLRSIQSVAPNLGYLSIGGNKGLTGNGLAYITNCTLLKSLKYNNKATDAAMDTFVQRCASIRVFRIDGSMLSIQGVTAMAENLESLVVFQCCNCLRWTVDMWSTLLNGSKSLRMIGAKLDNSTASFVKKKVGKFVHDCKTR